MCAIIGAELNEGLGVYQGGRPIDAQHLAKLVIINNNLWAVAVNVTKASIIAQYLRIFSSRLTRFCCYALLMLLIPAVCWSVFAGTFLCTPVAKLWKPELSGECMDPRKYWLSAAGINIGIDFTVLLLPLPAITQLRLPRKQKICLVLMFLLGFFVCVVSIVRLATVFLLERSGKLVGKSQPNIPTTLQNKTNPQPDSGIQAITWSAIEVNIGIICASLIALKPLLARFCPRMLDEVDVPKHCMRLPMVQTSADEVRVFCPSSLDATSPISPVSPSLARSSTSMMMVQRPSIVAMLPGMPQAERLSFL
jgi:hypothetical protein